jgi:diguanylate cyclase
MYSDFVDKRGKIICLRMLIIIVVNLLVNFALLTTFIFFGDILLSFLKKRWQLTRPQLLGLYGAGFGLFGITQLYFAFPVGEGTIIDFRQVSILASTYLGGTVSGLITASAIAIYRLFFLGEINFASILGAINAGSTFLLAALAFSSKLSDFRRWFLASCGVVFVATLILLTLVGPGRIGTIVLFDILCFMACQFNYLVINHLKRSHEAVKMLKEAAERDFLTGLHNSRAYNFMFRKTAELSALKQEPFSLLLLDIDHFKHVNDTYGHAAGDVVLSKLADILQDGVRIRDYCARKGGEEFVILLLRCGPDQGMMVAEKLRATVQNSLFEIPDHPAVKITISIGVSSFPEFDPSEMLERADEALYEAKEKGRNQVCYAESLGEEFHLAAQ